jgi:hypothetical protein
MSARLARARKAPSPTLLVACALALCTAGCSSLLSEGSATAPGDAGTAVAASVTKNAAVSAGIGLGVLAAADAGVRSIERDYHGHQQDRIAQIAGELPVGQVAPWQSRHFVELEPDEAGRVTVSRVISATDLVCKEIVFSVDRVHDTATLSSFYVATICKDSLKWRWATAEPATARWGNLQ